METLVQDSLAAMNIDFASRIQLLNHENVKNKTFRIEFQICL